MIFKSISKTIFLSNKRKLQLTVVFFCFFILLYTLLIFHNRRETHEICASEFCSLKGKEELFGLKKTVKKYDTICFPVNLLIASNRVKSTLKYEKIFKDLNSKFSNAKIKFILNTRIKRLSQSATIDQIEENKKQRNFIESKISKGIITIVIVPAGSNLNGFTRVLVENFWYYLGQGNNVIYISDKSNIGIGTFAHEFGHFFGLQHTFGVSKKEFSSMEKLNGENCSSEGDMICDTPPDFNLPISKQCNYSSIIKIKGYFPPVNNYMSYAPESCKNTFTKEQYSLMNLFANVYRVNLAR